MDDEFKQLFDKGRKAAETTARIEDRRQKKEFEGLLDTYNERVRILKPLWEAAVKFNSYLAPEVMEFYGIDKHSKNRSGRNILEWKSIIDFKKEKPNETFLILQPNNPVIFVDEPFRSYSYFADTGRKFICREKLNSKRGYVSEYDHYPHEKDPDREWRERKRFLDVGQAIDDMVYKASLSWEKQKQADASWDRRGWEKEFLKRKK